MGSYPFSMHVKNNTLLRLLVLGQALISCPEYRRVCKTAEMTASLSVVKLTLFTVSAISVLQRATAYTARLMLEACQKPFAHQQPCFVSAIILFQNDPHCRADCLHGCVRKTGQQWLPYVLLWPCDLGKTTGSDLPIFSSQPV